MADFFIPKPGDRGIGRQLITSKGPNAPLSGPTGAQGFSAGLVDAAELMARRSEERQLLEFRKTVDNETLQTIKEYGEFFRGKKQEFSQQNIRGEDYRQGLIDAVSERYNTLQEELPDAVWANVGRTILSQTLQYTDEIHQTASNHLREDGIREMRAANDELINTIVGEVRSNGIGDDSFDLWSQGRAQIRLQEEILRPAEMERELRAWDNQLFEILQADAEQRGARAVLEDLDRYPFPETLRDDAKRELEGLIEAQDRQARIDRNQARADLNRSFRQKYDSIELNLLKKMDSGQASLPDFERAMREVERDERAGLENASTQFQRIMTLRDAYIGDAEQRPFIEQKLNRGLILDQKEADQLYRQEPPEPDELPGWIRRTGRLPSAVEDDIIGAIRRGDVEKSLAYAQLVKELKRDTTGSHALSELDAQDLNFLTRLESIGDTDAAGFEQTYNELQKQVYGFTDSQRQENRRNWEDNLKPRWDNLKADVKNLRSIINPVRWVEKWIDPDVWDIKKNLIGVEGTFPPIPPEMENDLNENMEIMAAGMYSNSDAEFRNAVANSFVDIRKKWGPTTAFNNFQWTEHPPEQVFPRIDLFEDIAREQLRKSGYTTTKPPSAAALETVSFPGAVPAGAVLEPAETDKTIIFDPELFFHDFMETEDGQMIPRYRIRATIGEEEEGFPRGFLSRDFLRDPETGQEILIGGESLWNDYKKLIIERERESELEQRRTEASLDEFVDIQRGLAP